LKIISQTAPARFDKTVVLIADARYFPYALFTADMIHAHHPARDFDICLITPDPCPDHPLIAETGLRVLSVSMPDSSALLRTDHRFSVAAYLRLLVPSLLARDYRRILYMDGDMLLQRGDLSALLEADIGPHPLGAVRDVCQLRNPNRLPKDMAALGPERFRYLNSGLLLIDVPRYIKAEIGPRAMAMATDHAAQMKYHDQTALNAVLKGGWAELPLVWNFQFCQKTLYFAVHFNPAILHFITSEKPWSGRHGIYPLWIQDRYRRFFRLHFPEIYQTMQAVPAPAARVKTHAALLLHHAVNFGKFIRNTRRFKDDWDIKI
jgi:lipopolysaccharide biosynthesis glycosyltransferase